MPRRTGLDTLFDNSGPTGRDLLAASDAQTAAVLGGLEEPLTVDLDPEDYNEIREGRPGEFGTGRDDDMGDEDYQAAISAAISNAENYIDSELSPDREIAAKYYRAAPFGNEMENRSAVVMSEVRDKVLAVMPALLRIFCGTRHAVEFINNEGTPQAQADAQTAYVNHIINKDNPGFTVHHSAFKDALVRKTGIFTWWHEEVEIVGREVQTGLNEEAYALAQLEATEASSEDENLEFDIRVLRETPDTTAPADEPDLLGDAGDPMDPTASPAPQNFIRDIEIRKRIIKKRHRIAAVPPEEFICTPIASDDIDTFPLVGRRQMKMIGELVAMGHDEELIREKLSGGGAGHSQASAMMNNAEALDRNPAALERLFESGFEAVSEASEWVKYCVVYVLIDKDGDGILERRKVCTVGDNNAIIYDEIAEDDMVPFALLCPDPEPHSPFGFSLADQAMDMQEIKSEIMRGVLDSLAESIVGRTMIVEGQVNIDDALSNDRDQLIRVKNPDAIRPLGRPFNGAAAIPVMQYLDDVMARRTGVTMSPAGLAPDTLQSTSTEAVTATVDASQERVEMIARIFAETGIKRLMRGLLRQVVRHQDRKRIIRLRGKPITIDPRTFNADLDLETNVGLGRGTGPKRMGILQMILGLQKEVLEKYGPSNPMVGFHHISNTMEDLIHEADIADVARYMNVIDATENDQLREAQANQPKPPTPEELLYKAQSEKTQADERGKQRDTMMKFVIEMAKLDRQENRDIQDYFTKATELLGKFGIEVNREEMRAEQQREQAANALADGADASAQEQIAQIGGNNGPVQ